MPTKRVQRVGVGIRRRDNGLEAYVDIGTRRVSKTFPVGTGLREIQRWRWQQRLAPERVPIARVVIRPPRPAVRYPLSFGQWGWLYFIGDGQRRVKIGRATNVARRVAELQTSSAAPLILLFAVETVLELESRAHRRCCNAKLQGEWFVHTAAVEALMEALADPAQDPIAVLGDGDQLFDACHVPAAVPAVDGTECREPSQGVT